MRNTKLVRRIVNSHLATDGEMWTNKYKNCRTVKFYNEYPERTKAAISNLEFLGVDMTVTYRVGPDWRRAESVIIRLPITY